MGITKKPFGITKEKEQASLYILENENGMRAVFTDYGANLVELWVPDRNGKLADVVLGYDTVAGYENNGPGYGSFIGRCANRTAKAVCTIGGKEYRLEVNDGENNLHSGSKSYNKYMYEAETFTGEGEVSVEFSRRSPDMEQGFPGNLDITVTYTLTDENELAMEYLAVSDKDTVVNFTNHSYFNLAGHDSGSVLDEEVMIDADAFTPTDAALIPTGEIRPVDGTPMDFRIRKPLAEEIEADYEPLKLAGGYDHNFVLNVSGEEAEKVAELYDRKSGRLMEVFTDLPGMQLYSGNFIDGKEAGKGGRIYQKRDGVCFETQYYPNAINTPNFHTSLLKAYQEFESLTVYRFSVE